jgi:flagellar motor switch protein FliM
VAIPCGGAITGAALARELGAEFDVVLSADLGRLEMTTREVLGLRAGDVLHLSTRGEDALPIRVEGTPLMTGVAGVSRGRNAVRILGFDAGDLHLGD